MKGLLGWLILAVALAVPAFMFWNWWQAMDQGKPEGTRRIVPGGVFSAVSSAARLSNPIRSSTQAAVASPQSPQAASGPRPEGAAATGTVPPGGTAQAAVASPPSPPAAGVPTPSGTAAESAPEAAASATGSASQGAAPAPPAPGAKPGGEDALEYKPQTSRDPTLSPNDVKRLAKRAFDEAMSKQSIRVETKRRPAAPPEAPIETRLNLMGIIETPRGTTVIVNDRILKVKDCILGACIRRISGSHVDFVYKNRGFRKSIQK